MICYILILATIFSLSIMVANREAAVIFIFFFNCGKACSSAVACAR